MQRWLLLMQKGASNASLHLHDGALNHVSARTATQSMSAYDLRSVAWNATLQDTLHLRTFDHSPHHVPELRCGFLLPQRAGVVHNTSGLLQSWLGPGLHCISRCAALRLGLKFRSSDTTPTPGFAISASRASPRVHRSPQQCDSRWLQAALGSDQAHWLDSHKLHLGSNKLHACYGLPAAESQLAACGCRPGSCSRRIPHPQHAHARCAACRRVPERCSRRRRRSTQTPSRSPRRQRRSRSCRHTSQMRGPGQTARSSTSMALTCFTTAYTTRSDDHATCVPAMLHK